MVSELSRAACRSVNIGDRGGSRGGGVLGVRTPPPLFGGPPHFIKRGKNVAIAF